MSDRSRVDVCGLSKSLPTTTKAAVVEKEGEERLVVVKRQFRMEVNFRWLKYAVAFSIISVCLFIASTLHFAPVPFQLLSPTGSSSSRSSPTDSIVKKTRPVTNNSTSSSCSTDSTRSDGAAAAAAAAGGASAAAAAVLDCPPRPADLPRIAYFLTGTKGDSNRMKRLLLALYHPHNEYLLHMDRESPVTERIRLARFVAFHPIFLQVGNVRFIVKSNLVTYRGPTMIATTLHGMSIFLRKKSEWDWFINLSASDYPLITQDDFLDVLSSSVPRGMNFLEHSSKIPGWKINQRVHAMVVDPAIYRLSKSDLVYFKETREVPDSFNVFQGSAWMMLSRNFCEYLIYGRDNLPRLALMYFANVVTSPESYFHTVVCNSRDFINTTVNSDLHYIAWDHPPKQHPLTLNFSSYSAMVNASVPFARKFDENDTVLDTIDAELLRGRRKGHVVVGGWCVGNTTKVVNQVAVGGVNNSSSSASGGGEAGALLLGVNSSSSSGSGGDQARDGHGDGGQVQQLDPCAVIGNPVVLKPGKGAKRVKELMEKLLEPTNLRERQCV